MKGLDQMKENIEKIYNETKENYKKEIDKWITKEELKMIITANPEILTKATKDKNINNMLAHEKVSIIPDGISVVKAQKKLKIQYTERITGIDICEYILEKANREKLSVYFFGATVEVISRLKLVVDKNYSNINVLGYTNGYVSDKDCIMHDIIEKQPDFCLVAMGVPYQEELIFKYIDRYKKGVFVGVGGSFDVISGSKRRAPKLFVKLNLEWLYRIMTEPSRISRFLKNNVLFLLKVKK